jgi:hypothetical protein
MNPVRSLAQIRNLAGSRRAIAIGVAVAAGLIVLAGARLTGPGDTATVTTTAAQTGRPQPSPSTAPWQPPNAASPPAAPTTPAPSAPAVGDTVDDPAPAPTDVRITTGPVDPREAASILVAKILNTYGRTAAQWRANFANLLTPQLRDLYANVDPAETHVPHGVVGSPIVATTIGQGVVTVTVPVVDNTGQPLGTVTTTLVGTSHQWLAAQIDWAAT